MALVLRYRSTRAEVWQWYWRCWRAPRGLWRIHLSLFIGVFAFSLWQLTQLRGTLAANVPLAFCLALVAIAWMPLWPLISFKPQERVLTLDEAGATTTIGSKSGSISWNEVAAVEDQPGVIAIRRSNGNAFLIPDRAFASPEERATVFSCLKRWWVAAVPTATRGSTTN